ncbi:universal stress protein [Candidatus Obscuribacterales bacterium]|nr:universal stress protein [Candidatus Obscuribacterales bacterium]
MHKLSILLGLTGSEQSKYAAEVAWSIAKDNDGRVTAMHVVDTRMAWELLRNDRPGFVGSGVYVEAFEQLSSSLERIGQTVIEKFEAVAAGQEVPTKTILAQGSPVSRMSERAGEFDLVVIGHQARDPRCKEAEHCNFIRYAVAEGLAHDCPRPLLVVQDKVYRWSSMSILVSVDHINFSYIAACRKMADSLGLQAKLVILASGEREASPVAILSDLRSAHSELTDVDISVEFVQGIAMEKHSSPWRHEPIDLEWTPDPETLLVIPTRKTGGHRITVFDTTPDAFVRCLGLPTIMMWPEEHTEFDVKMPEERAAAAR